MWREDIDRGWALSTMPRCSTDRMHHIDTIFLIWYYVEDSIRKDNHAKHNRYSRGSIW